MQIAILVAAGSSQRMGFDKLAYFLEGKSVAARSTLAFLGHSQIDLVILVCSKEREQTLQRELATCLTKGPSPTEQEQQKLLNKLHFTRGGKRRQDSVLAGLLACPKDTTLVAIHDAARPLISAADITQTLLAAKQTGAAVLASPVVDSLVRAQIPQQNANEENSSTSQNPQAEEPVAREHLWATQTPQCFRHKELLAALQLCQQQEKQVTDEVSAAHLANIPVTLVPALAANFKLTRPEDMQLATLLLQQQETCQKLPNAN